MYACLWAFRQRGEIALVAASTSLSAQLGHLADEASSIV